MSLLDFRIQPIPPAVTNQSALDYHLIAIELDGEANLEPLVPVSEYEIIYRSAYSLNRAPYYRSFSRALPVPLVRKSVALRLRLINQLLVPYDAELVILDAYRPVPLQKELWHHFIEVAREKLPDASEDDLVKFVGQYWSDPRTFDASDFRTWPTHSTGGAVDLTLQDKSVMQELFMGSVFDDVDSISSTRHFEDPSLTSLSAIDARQNRRLLYNAMTEGGFFNYHHEWWHYDFGTQMAIMNGAQLESALYGIAHLTESLGELH